MEHKDDAVDEVMELSKVSSCTEFVMLSKQTLWTNTKNSVSDLVSDTRLVNDLFFFHDRGYSYQFTPMNNT